MTDAEGKEVVGLGVKCTRIAVRLQEGLEIAASITGRCHLSKGDKTLEQPGDLLENLRVLVDAIDCRTKLIMDQLNRIQNQL